ncbi:hypothetical protein FHY02_003766 [Sphingomonas sp. BK069]|nr:hypothetical protein [Sphingomonas sp. BK069]
MMGATWSASPAAGRCMSGEPFVLDGRVAKVEERFPSPAGLQADALLIRFDKSAPGQIGLLGTTVESLEQRIARGRVHFLESASSVNVRHGWMGNVVSTTMKCCSGRYEPHAEVFAHQPTSPRRLPTSRPVDCAVDGLQPADSRLTSMAQGIHTDRSTRPAEWRVEVLSLIVSRSSMSSREAFRHLRTRWRPEWGVPPSYSTVRRWVAASRPRVLARPSVRDLDERRAFK